MITQKEVKELFYYENGELYWRVSRTNRVKVGQRVGSKTMNKYACATVNNKPYKVHRLIFLYHHGWMPKEIDHINNLKHDNRIENLRPVTKTQNQYNAKLRRDNISGIKNVSWYSQTKKWKVQIKINGKKKHLAYTDDLEFAELIAEEARNKYHKTFARAK